MGIGQSMAKASLVPKELVTVGKEEGLSEDFELEVRGLMLGGRNDILQQGFDRNMRPIYPVLYPLVLRRTVYDPASGERAWGDGEEATAQIEALPGAAADKLFKAADKLLNLTEGGKASKNGSGGGESLSTTSPTVSDGEA